MTTSKDDRPSQYDTADNIHNPQHRRERPAYVQPVHPRVRRGGQYWQRLQYTIKDNDPEGEKIRIGTEEDLKPNQLDTRARHAPSRSSFLCESEDSLVLLCALSLSHSLSCFDHCYRAFQNSCLDHCHLQRALHHLSLLPTEQEHSSLTEFLSGVMTSPLMSVGPDDQFRLNKIFNECCHCHSVSQYGLFFSTRPEPH